MGKSGGGPMPRRENESEIIKMPRVFSWEYFSFLQIDDTVMSKEMLAIPLLLVVLVTVWMQLVRGQGKTGLDFEEAYNDAKANEVDSGTELEEDEIEEIGGVEEKEEGEKKDD